MDGLIQWVKNLIFIILFTALLEMFLPENDMSKYLRVVMGFFIITVLISPLMMIFDQDFSVIQDVIPENMINNNWDQIQRQGRKIEESNQTLLMGYYEKKVINRVKEVVSLNYDNYRKDIKVGLDDNYRIEFLSVVLIDRGINRVEIEAINIANNIKGSPHEKKDEEIIKEEITEKIKEKRENLRYKLSQVFQIPGERIEVIFKKGA